MYKVLTLNNISVEGLRRLPRELYEVASDMSHPDGIMVRSFKMHDMEIPESVKAVARAGAGVNNIPVDEPEGSPLGRRHAGQHLQCHAGERNTGPRRFHGRVRKNECLKS
jgi:phosphoglycerate dehydrogenase-like enzyme